MAESQEIGALRRRGRRRLVGAIALVLLAVIVLPMVFDSEPRQGAPAVSVRIPGEDDAVFSPKATPRVPVTPVAPKPVPAPPPQEAQKPPAPKTEAKPDEKPAAQAAAKAPGADAERQRAVAAISGEQFVVPVAALASAEKVNELVARLIEAKLPYYTESVATAQGPVTRVRVGPFDDRAAAEKAMERLKGLGLKPGNVTGKS
ncbi:MAG: SPOR domain-containing protein [Burkholderiales bacterium]